MAYAKAVIATAEKALATPIRKDAVFAAGFSNGAMFTHRLGCQLSSVFRGIFTHSGLLTYGDAAKEDQGFTEEQCRLDDPNYKPLSVLAVLGFADRTIKMEPLKDLETNQPCGCQDWDPCYWNGFNQTRDHWVAKNRCDLSKVTRYQPFQSKGMLDPNTYCTKYTECMGGTVVEFCSDGDLVHWWHRFFSHKMLAWFASLL